MQGLGRIDIQPYPPQPGLFLLLVFELMTWRSKLKNVTIVPRRTLFVSNNISYEISLGLKSDKGYTNQYPFGEISINKNQ